MWQNKALHEFHPISLHNYWQNMGANQTHEIIEEVVWQPIKCRISQ